MKRLVYLLSFLGFALFASQIHSVRRIHGGSQPRGRKRFAGPIIDLNHASEEELRALDGVAEYVEKIIEERPFNSKIDLLERMIVPDAIYNDIKQRITVRHAA